MKNYTLPPLGSISPEKFLSEYWQKKPLLIRQAIPNFEPIFTPNEIFALARNDEVETRLVSQFDGKWSFKRGPFKKLPKLSQDCWTLLLQGANLYDDQADDLLRRFRFIPDTRLDDLMISIASNGGGVGPHFDNYDVFLLQAHGKRRWRISNQSDLALIDGLPLKILKNFEAESEWELEPGDMLYLPPHCAHDGVAIGECMTYSIGFRAPPLQELAENFLHFMSETIEVEGRVSDPDLKFNDSPAEINQELIAQVLSSVKKIQFDEASVQVFLGEYLSEPKQQVVFSPPKPFLTREKFEEQASLVGIKLSRKSIMLYKRNYIFLNGESFIAEEDDFLLLCRLANNRCLSERELSDASSDLFESLCVWYEDGWIELKSNCTK